MLERTWNLESDRQSSVLIPPSFLVCHVTFSQLLNPLNPSFLDYMKEWWCLFSQRYCGDWRKFLPGPLDQPLDGMSTLRATANQRPVKKRIVSLDEHIQTSEIRQMEK